MKKFYYYLWLLFLLAFLLVPYNAILLATPIDLNYFYSESGLKNKALAFIHNSIEARNPATLLLLSIGLLGLTGLSRKQPLK